jgi:hypothetical protein
MYTVVNEWTQSTPGNPGMSLFKLFLARNTFGIWGFHGIFRPATGLRTPSIPGRCFLFPAWRKAVRSAPGLRTSAIPGRCFLSPAWRTAVRSAPGLRTPAIPGRCFLSPAWRTAVRLASCLRIPAIHGRCFLSPAEGRPLDQHPAWGLQLYLGDASCLQPEGRP